MKYILLILVISFLDKSSCRKKQNSLPACITQKIEQIKKEAVWNPPAEVNEYLYEDKHVFLFSSNCCDQYNVIYDENCNAVCAPSGGYTGKGDGKCPDFSEKAQFFRLVWKDERAAK